MINNKIRVKIILTADDFGKNGLANEKILELAEAGKLDRVSVMTDGEFSPGEIRRIKNANMKLDIHLELDWQKKKRGITKDNTIRQGIVFLVNHFQASRRKKIREDWEGQIKKFHEVFGKYPDGLNSHEYVHLFPAYFKIALGLAREYGIPFVRFGKKGLRGRTNAAKKLILDNLRKLNKNFFFSSGLKSSDYFASLDWAGNIENFLKNIPEGKIEVACHPERAKEFELVKRYF